MDTYWGLYWLTRLEGINTLLKTFGVITTIICAILFIVWVLSDNSEECNGYVEFKFLSSTRKTIKRIWISLTPTLIILWMIYALIPTQREAIFIVAGGKTLNWAIQDSSLSKLPSQSTQLMSTFLEQQINSLTKDINEDVKSKVKDAKDSLSSEINGTITKNLLKK